jgi:stress response protein YsnF
MKEHEKVVREEVVVGTHAVKENEWVEETVCVAPAQYP